ncbi:PucR family transcriptional regulator [Gulosibacter chungangensis]|uniref:PucR family transcriptional regulator n=1 Tax=Gulosibacter chungangensis TaxID=979746 RepID=UPI0017883899|nr:helix-turn-helix domain-containing protein [Gulosibacter chungangensis]
MSFLQVTMRNLPESDQLEYVLARVSRITNCALLVYDSQGDVIAAIGDVPAKLIWEFAADATPDAQGRVGRWSLRIRRSGPSGGIFTLVFASRESRDTNLLDEVVDATDVAITAVLGAMRGTDVRRIRDIAQLLETLESGIQAAREHRYWPRLVEFGFSAHSPLLVAVCEPLTGLSPPQEFIAGLLDDAAAAGVPFLVAARLVAATSDSSVHGILPDDALARSWLSALASQFSIGVSSPHSGLPEIPTAVREAEHAQQVAHERNQARLRLALDATASEAVDYRTLRLTNWTKVEAPGREFRARRRALLTPFDEHETILETVVTYLATNLSAPKTAEILFLHTNTVRYRLSRAEELLGESLSSPFTLADLVLALSPEIAARKDLLEENH